MKKLEKKISTIRVKKLLLASLIVIIPSLINKARAQPNGAGLNVQFQSGNFNNISLMNSNNTSPVQNIVQVNNSQQQFKTNKKAKTKRPHQINSNIPQAVFQNVNPAVLNNTADNNISVGNEDFIQEEINALDAANNPQLSTAQNYFSNTGNSSKGNKEADTRDVQVEQNDDNAGSKNASAASSSDGKPNKGNRNRSFASSQKSRHTSHYKFSGRKHKAKIFSYCMNKKSPSTFVKNRKVKFDPAACFAWN